MKTSRLVLQNSVLNLVASVSQRIGQTIIFILVARMLTAEAAGAFKLANTYTSILLTLGLWGLDQLLIREVARDRTKLAQYLGSFLLLRVGLGLLVWCLLALLMPLFPYASSSKQLILIMAATIIPGSINNLYQAVWVAFEDMKRFSAVTLVFSLVRLVGGVWVLWQQAALAPVAVLFLVTSVAEMVTNMWVLQRHMGVVPWRVQLDASFWWRNLKLATPLILVSYILVVEYQFDDVILSFFWPEDEVGVYGTAATILSLLLFITRSIQMALFPVISRAYHTSEAYLQRVYSLSLKFLLLLAFPIALVLSLLATPSITLIFGEPYAPAGEVLQVLVWAFFISAFNVANSRLLVVADRQRVMAWFALLSMTGNILLSLLLVPRLGGVGTAWARVLAMPLYSIPALVYVQRHLCPLDWRTFWRFDWQTLRDLK